MSQACPLQVRVRMAGFLPFAILLMMLSWACAGPASVVNLPPRLIAHSGGIGNQRSYTNSLEALDNSVARGFAVIEVDLSWTSDHNLVLLHDWNHEFGKLFDRSAGRLTLDQFQSLQSAHGLSHLDLKGLVEWMLDNPGILIVTDIKERNIEGLRLIAEKHPKLIPRIIPQIFRPTSYFEVTELGYEWIVLSLYRTELSDRQVVEFATSNPLYGVTIPARRALEGTLSTELAAKGVRVYAHTVNDHPTVKALQSRGVYGVYTDWLTPRDEHNLRPLSEWRSQTEGELALDGFVVPFLPLEMAGMKTAIDFDNTSETFEPVRLYMLDSGGRSIATDEFEIPANGTHQVNLERFSTPQRGHGWLRIEAADGVEVHFRWQFHGDVEGVWASDRVARNHFETGGPGSGVGGVLVAVVNPTESIQSYRLRRRIGGDLIDDDEVELEAMHQAVRVYRSQTEEELHLTVSGGPMVTQVLRWDPMGRFMR